MNIDSVLEYEKLVYSIISKFSGYADKDDLYQAGMIGLIEAFKNFKNDGLAKFSTYAYTYILGEVTKLIREDRTVKVSRDLIKLNRSIERCRELLRQKLLREPSDTEISLFLNIEEDDIMKARNACLFIKSLDETMDEDDKNSYYNSVKVYDKNTDSRIIDLKEELNRLNEDDKKLIYDRYYIGYTQSEVSSNLGISQVQVSRKENKILEKLKVRL